MIFIELSDYSLPPFGTGVGINEFYFNIKDGDVCAIVAANPDDACTFLRALAMLVSPIKGSYRYKGEYQDFKNYSRSLQIKKKIGYIAPDAALISNLTIRQNLLLNRFYHENDLHIQIDKKMRFLCESFDLSDKLDHRPASLNIMEIQSAIIVREICKDPEVLLLNRPEDFIGHSKFDFLTESFNRWIGQKLPVVFISYDRRLIRRFANRKILITNGTFGTLDINRNNGTNNGI
ncbi:MAG: ATP-binding cassette domain-containing protein [Desulfobacteraceae bacterium]|nr:ATP-binding cassette domain-containing protein [Desulfobacteraceae bacterium]